MKKKFKFTVAQSEWLKILESGKFRQGKELLHQVKNKRSSYCCLGVACKIFKDILNLNYTIQNEVERRYNDEEAGLPEVVYEHLNLHGNFGDLAKLDLPEDVANSVQGCDSLADMNDQGWTHKEIATFIRAHPTAVFKN